MADNVNRLLIVEDEPEVVAFIAEVGRKLGFAIASTGDGTDFVRLVDTFRPSLIVMDLHLPDTDGVELLRSLVARDCKAHILLLSGVDERVLTDGLRGRREPRPFDVRQAYEAAFCLSIFRPSLPLC